MSYTHILRMTPKHKDHATMYAESLLKNAQAKKLRNIRRLISYIVNVTGIIGIIMSLSIVHKFLFGFTAKMVWRGLLQTWGF